MADEQVVHLLIADPNGSQSRLHLLTHSFRGIGDFTQGSGQQVIPQPPLDPDGFQTRVFLVESFQGGDVPLVRGAAGAEVLLNSFPIGPDDVFQGHQRRVPQPLVQEEPPVRVFQGEGVGAGQTDLGCSGPAQQPTLTVGEDSHADPSLLRRLGQVVIQLPHVLRGGFTAGGGANPALELDEGVQSGKVNGATGGVRWRVFLDNLLASGQVGEDEEVSHRAGDLGFGLEAVVSQHKLCRCITIPGVGYVYVLRHARPCFPNASECPPLVFIGS